MTWHTNTVATDAIAVLLDEIRRHGGTVTSCRHCAEGVCVTWTTR